MLYTTETGVSKPEVGGVRKKQDPKSHSGRSVESWPDAASGGWDRDQPSLNSDGSFGSLIRPGRGQLD